MIHKFEWKILFEPRDLWVGVFWRRWPKAIQVYICIVPMVPLVLYIQWQSDAS